MPHHRALPGRAHREGRLREGQGLLRLEVHGRRARTRACKRGHDEIKALPEITSRHGRRSRTSTRTSSSSSTSSTTRGATTGASFRSRSSEVEKMAADFKLLLMPEITVHRLDRRRAGGRRPRHPEPERAGARPRRQALPARSAEAPLAAQGAAARRAARLIILGIRKKWRHVRKYAAAQRLHVRRDERGRPQARHPRGGARLDARGQRPRQRRHPADGREALQEVPRLREAAHQRRGAST